MGYGYLSKQEEENIIKRINQLPEFRYCGIAYVGRGNSYVIRPSLMPEGLGSWIVISEVKESLEKKTVKEVAAESNFSWGWEVFGLTTSCGAAVLTGVAAAGGIAATPVTGGGSLAITTLAWAGAAATAAQCGLSAGRIVNEFIDPSHNQMLDDSEYYQYGTMALDTISIVGGASSIKGTVQFGRNLSKATGRPLMQTFKQSEKLSRGARKRLPRILAEADNPKLTSRQFKQMVKDGVAPKIFRVHDITKEVRTRLLESISAGLSMMGSGASGMIKKFAVYIVNEE
ncbi:hypothetical protein OKW21_004042 [Catalinimonas alkaloidigena]|uniref:hypothetical protein n=1 Tax=Catalinimonas alkaloidigena TaxID=1075417 RepID=UPI0024053227|nr:hypothetical protein [Catalinimonas alkaloidigena]MDF9798779.1 hypothetical protein [Catalinimonas alkaloidigena]